MHELASQEFFASETRGINEKLASIRGWEIVTISYPSLEVIFTNTRLPALRVRMVCNNWDEDPPSIQLLSKDGEYLTAIQTDPKGILNNSSHPVTHRPFICMRGSREYHTHPSHTNDPWDGLRGKSGYDLGGILTKVWNAWKEIR